MNDTEQKSVAERIVEGLEDFSASIKNKADNKCNDKIELMNELIAELNRLSDNCKNSDELEIALGVQRCISVIIDKKIELINKELETAAIECSELEMRLEELNG